jgi:hypothetical protein
MWRRRLSRNFDGASQPPNQEPRMHPALIQQMALERSAAFYAAARARRTSAPAAPRRTLSLLRALHLAHA